TLSTANFCASRFGRNKSSPLLGPWGTTPGLNFIYAHLNRVTTRTSVTAARTMIEGIMLQPSTRGS
ncbi:hypothetical protein GUK36_40035, partial [Rhizobium leguminosarum]